MLVLSGLWSLSQGEEVPDFGMEGQEIDVMTELQPPSHLPSDSLGMESDNILRQVCQIATPAAHKSGQKKAKAKSQ